MKKRVKFFLMITIFLILIQTCSALRVTPAKIETNFYPGLETSIDYEVSKTDKNLELYVAGDLAEYVQFDKKFLPVGGGVFTVTLKLPEFIEKPGAHTIYIGVKEVFDEELAGSQIGTSVTIETIITIYVPYPGKYLEIVLRSQDVNIGEPVDIELDIISKGEDNVNVTPVIDILSENKTIETLSFKNREIKSQEEVK
ncbi:MAG: hypothetical protein KKF68_01595, partial [Nanoarchaeota archaeon]|nr:hypothetical protein [Nanoarchaeota archaeon]